MAGENLPLPAIGPADMVFSSEGSTMGQAVANGVGVAFRWSLILFLVGWGFSILSVAPLRAESLMLTALTTSLGLAGVCAFLAASSNGHPGESPAESGMWRGAAFEFFAASLLLAQGIAVVLLGDVLAVWCISQIPDPGAGWTWPGLIQRFASLAALGATSVAAGRWSAAGQRLQSRLSRMVTDPALERRTSAAD